MLTQGKHENYEILNLIGYGLAKFNSSFIKALGFATKSAFYQSMVDNGIADTTGTIKNRQDLFDPFFDNPRKGWWQKGDMYIHRKILIDSLFGTLDTNAFANIVALYLQDKFGVPASTAIIVSPVIKSKFKQLQITGQEAELFFISNYIRIASFKTGILEDARMFGDGYDFQIKVLDHFYLAEVKGLRTSYGSVRMTSNEFHQAKVYGDNYALIIVNDLGNIPKMNAIFNPTENIAFTKQILNSEQITYHTSPQKWG